MDTHFSIEVLERTLTELVITVFITIVICFLLKELSMGICTCKKNLNGSIAIVTGADSGIGFETSIGLVKSGAKVYLCCKTLELAKDAVERLKVLTRCDPDCVVGMEMDLSSLKNVRSFVKQFLKCESQLDILVNNAGIPSGCFANQTNGEHTLTEDNLEIVMQTNYFGHFLLTNLLKDALKKSSDARVVNLSSIYYILGEIKLTNLNGENFFSNQQAYPNSKLALMMFSTEISSRWKLDGIKSYSVHPGFVRSNLFSNTSRIYRYIHPLFSLIFGKTSFQGAQTTLHCCLSESLRNGSFYMDCCENNFFTNKATKDKILLSGLWEKSELFVKLNCPEKGSPPAIT